MDDQEFQMLTCFASCLLKTYVTMRSNGRKSSEKCLVTCFVSSLPKTYGRKSTLKMFCNFHHTSALSRAGRIVTKRSSGRKLTEKCLVTFTYSLSTNQTDSCWLMFNILEQDRTLKSVAKPSNKSLKADDHAFSEKKICNL